MMDSSTFVQARFAAACWSARQWQTGSSWDTQSPFLIEGLIGNQVRSASFFEQTNTARYTPLKTAYVDAAAKYNISNFVPHGEGCDVEDVCPDCN
ncbi:MAG: hypothetical protein IT430_10390 [Phycisphaerales bacterium]|nr:hypothetical protein [Phycisphaerales bacterium]